MVAAGLAELIGGDPLNEKELEILLGAANGETCRQTAERLHYSWEYVKDIRKRAEAKLCARTIAHAVAIALATGVLNPDMIEGGVL